MLATLRLRDLLLIGLVIAAVTLSVSGGTAHATPNYDWPGMKKCGTFKAEYRIWVYAKHITCRTARRIQKEYWLGPDSRKVVYNGGTGAGGWITLKRFPGWKCTSGAGGGGCSRGRKSASYQN
jgi:hypothetical protein